MDFNSRYYGHPYFRDQGNNWNVNVVDLSQFKGIVKIVFRGIVGGNYRSDIAIDDVSIRDAQPIGIDVNHTKEHTFSLFLTLRMEVLLSIVINKYNKLLCMTYRVV